MLYVHIFLINAHPVKKLAYSVHTTCALYCQVARDIPGIDAAFLAMDTDDGVEVVWNEVRYSNRKSGRKEMLVKILQRLTEFKHTNIVNFINFWHDRVNNQDRVSQSVCQCV